MYNKSTIEDAVGPGLIGSAVVGVVIFWGFDGRLVLLTILGFLFGVIAGYAAAVVMLVPILGIQASVRRFFAVMLAGLGAPLLFFVSVQFAVGYFAGAGSIFCFCLSIANLKNVLKRTGK